MSMLFLGLVIFLFLGAQNISAHSQTYIIEMTVDGFLPETLTIDENSTIIFINKDKEARWPASNTHPTHELYPEFDPKLIIEPNGSWVFKVNKIGIWKFHDHLKPHFRGEIIVLAEKKSADKMGVFELPKNTMNNVFISFQNISKGFLKRIAKSFNFWFGKKVDFMSSDQFIKLKLDQQQLELTNLFKSKSSTEIWSFFKKTFKDQAGSAGNIHDLAHLTGMLIYENLGFEGIKVCGGEFAFGCFHGFLDKAFVSNLDHLLDAQKACLNLNPKNNNQEVSGPAASCIHGIGHGVASFYSVTNLKEALKTCRKLTLGAEYCFDGVFMEFVRSAPETFFNKDDPLDPCDKLEKDFGYTYSFSCGRNQPTLLMSRLGFSFDQVVGVCLYSDSKPIQQACFDSLGFLVAKSIDSQVIIAGCQKIKEDQFIARCIKAAAGELVFQDVVGWQEKSTQVCSSLGKENSECLMYVEQLAKEYGK